MKYFKEYTDITKPGPWAMKTRFEAYIQCITYSRASNKGPYY